MRKTFWEEKIKRKNLVYNPNYIYTVSCKRLDSLKLETRNKKQNFSQKSFKTIIPQKNNLPKKSSFLNHISRNEIKKLSLNSETIPFHDKNFIKEFEGLFQQVTNKNIFDYCNGFEVEKMGDFVKTMKEYNTSDFLRELKKRNSKNKQNKSKYNPRNVITQQNNYWSRPHSSSHYKKNKIEKESCSDAYLSTESTDRYTLSNFKYENNNSCSIFTHRKYNRNINFIKNKKDRIKLFE